MQTVVIFEARNIMDLERAKSVLDDQRIPWFIRNEFTRNNFGGSAMIAGNGPGASPVQIHVSKENTDNAVEALRAIFPAAYEDETERAENNIVRDSNKEESLPGGNGANLFKMFVLAILGFTIAPVLFVIPYYFRLKKNYIAAKIIAALVMAGSLAAGIYNNIIIKKDPYNLLIIAVSSFCLLSAVKSFSLFIGRKRVLAILFLIPLVVFTVLMFASY